MGRHQAEKHKQKGRRAGARAAADQREGRENPVQVPKRLAIDPHRKVTLLGPGSAQRTQSRGARRTFA